MRQKEHLLREMPVPITIDTNVEATDEVRGKILGPLSEFNAANGYPPDPESLAIVLREESGEIVGGLWGKTVYGWLFVEFLVVDDSLRGRGYGAELIGRAEAIARDRGCAGSWLTTFSFQAQGFYEKLGYSVFGQLDESPGKNVRIFMQKKLRQA